MKSKKKIIALALSMLLLLTAFVAATFAYFTDGEAVTNTLTVGNVEIDLYESQTVYTPDALEADKSGLVADDAAYQDFLKNADNTNIMPGHLVPKNTYIENTGKNDAYVRFYITIPADFVNKVSNPAATSKNALILNFNNADYTVEDMGNGTYYVTYNNILKAGEFTSNGLVSVQLNPYLSSAEYEALVSSGAITVTDGVASFDVVVRADAIQQYGFADVDAAFDQFETSIQSNP